MSEASPPVAVVLIGAGHRSMGYGTFAEHEPKAMRVVGVAEPDARRRQRAAERFNIPAQRQYASAEALAAEERFADAAINGTMDRQHLATTLPLLRAGYDVLLEKPFAVSEEETWQFVQTVRETGRKLMICHVLRYAPFYRQIRERVAAGAIGDIINVRTAEYVSYHHMATAFVRGKWNRRAINPILLAKCCHDLDLICWMKSGVWPQRVSSFGGRMLFTPEAAPHGAGTRCLVDCEIERECPYSAGRMYVEQKLWGSYAWESLEHLDEPTDADKLESLRTDNPYGRCVWHCDNDVADHQGVLVEFADGCTAQHTLVGGVPRSTREIHLIGTQGEIQGDMERGVFHVRNNDLTSERHFSEESVEVNVKGNMHGGGDLRLVADFARIVRGESPSISTTHLDDSVASHLIAFAADRAMQNGEACEVSAAPGLSATVS
ncbi:MAG: Gfo/Idh/MocA family protein [Phycisphaeraceae bacterium]